MSKPIVYLKDIACKGMFGPVKIGMPYSEVIDLLGEPGGISKIDEWCTIIIYGWYEIFFYKWEKSNNLEVIAFQNDHMDASNCFDYNEHFKVDLWFLRFGLTLGEAKQLLDQEKISYTIEKRHEVYFVCFENESTLLFENSNAEEEGTKEIEDFPLRGISFHPKL